MSQENVELARQYFEALNAHGALDFERTEHFRHPEVELQDPPDLPDSDRYVGEAALRERVRSFAAVGWDGQLVVQEYLDAGDEVIVMFRAIGSGSSSGVPLDVTAAHVLLFEGGKIRRIRQYFTRAEALEAAGLRE
jgi:ketosteroid isomerase-like protein